MLITLLSSLALAAEAEAPPASPSFEDAAEQLYAEQGVLQQTWHVVPSRNGYYVANAKGKRVSTQSVVQLGGDPAAIRRVNKLHYASRLAVGVGLVPIAAGVATEEPSLIIGGAAVAAPLALTGLALGYRLRQTERYMDMDTADQLVGAHNVEVLQEEGVAAEEISAMLQRGQMLYVETVEGRLRVHQGTDLLAPSEFALLVGDAGKLGRFAVGSGLTVTASVGLAAVSLGGLFIATFSLAHMLLTLNQSQQSFNQDLRGLVGGAAVGVLSGMGSVAVVGGYQIYKSRYSGWYSDEEIYARVEAHNASVRGEQPPEASLEPKRPRVALRPVLAPGAVGLAGSF